MKDYSAVKVKCNYDGKGCYGNGEKFGFNCFKELGQINLCKSFTIDWVKYLVNSRHLMRLGNE